MNENMIEGRNAVLEAFRSGKTVDKLYVLDGCKDGPVQTILREARKQDTILQFVGKERLSQLSETGKHQGVIAVTSSYHYSTVEEMLELAKARGEDPFLILLDNIEDRSRSDSSSGKDISWRPELYTGCQGYQSGKDDGRIKRTGPLVCVCRYGRRTDV